MEPAPATYGVREVARLLGWSAARVRALARAGGVANRRGPRGELRFEFRDLAFLRRLRDLPDAHLSTRRVRRALTRLRATLPPERDLRELGLASAGGELVVRERGRQWSPDSGQFVFDFEPARRQECAEPAPLPARPGAERDADGWYRLGCEMEAIDGERARRAYERALALDAAHADAHVNLGCLDHEAGRLADAEAHYRASLAVRPDDTTARFDLAVLLEDLGRDSDARTLYAECVAADPECAEAHFNLARLAERAGDDEAVVRHLVAYRRLLRD